MALFQNVSKCRVWYTSMVEDFPKYSASDIWACWIQWYWQEGKKKGCTVC